MMRQIALLLLVVAPACSAEVDLELAPGERAGVPGAALGPLAWAEVPGGEAESMVVDMAWTPDGGLLADLALFEPDVESSSHERSTLVRYDADGTRRWVVEVPGGRSPLSVTADGGAVTAHHRNGWLGDLPVPPAGLDWFDSSGELIETWRPLPSDELGDLDEVMAVQALPDGGAVFAASFDGPHRAVAGRVDGAGQLLWIVPVVPSEGPPSYDTAKHVVAMPDGGMVVSVDTEPFWSPGEEDPDPLPRRASYLVRLDPDGSEVWRVLLESAQPFSLDLAPSGDLVVAGSFQGTMTAGDLRFESDLEELEEQPFLLEVAADGRVLAGRTFDHPLPSPSGVVSVWTAGYSGDRLRTAGIPIRVAEDIDWAPPAIWIADYDLDGNLLDHSLLPVSGGGHPTGPTFVAMGPTGQVAIGGIIRGAIDFGDGEVSTGEGSPMKAFIAVFDPGGVD